MRHRTALWLMLAHVGFAAGTYVCSKEAAVGFSDPAALTWLRAAGAAVILLCLTGWSIPAPHFRAREWAVVLGLGVLLVPLNQFPFIAGMRRTVTSHPALLYALTPMGVLLLSAAVAHRWPPRNKLAGVAVAFAGVIVLLRPWEAGPDFSELRIGDLWVSGAVLSWVVYTVAARRMCQIHDPRTVTAWGLILGAVVMTPLGLPAALRENYTALSAAAWGGLVWMVLITSVVMMLLWNVLLKYLEPVEVAICSNAQPPVTALLSGTLAGIGLVHQPQDLGPAFWLGMVLVLVGVTLVQRRLGVAPRAESS